MIKKLVLIAAMLTLMTGPAWANTVIDFAGGASPGGTVTLTSTRIIGTQIHLGVMTVENAPNYPGVGHVFNTVDAYLNFDSNAGGNNFTIVGLIGSPFNIGTQAPVALLTGQIQGWEWGVGDFGWLRVWGPDLKNAQLLTALGLPTDTPFRFMEFNLYGSSVGTDTYSALSYDVRNTAIPEPGSMLLLGSGLVGLAGAVRRRMKK